MVGESRDDIVPYTLDQMTALLRAAKGSRNAARWTLALALGLRQGEVLGVCWDDPTVPGKGGTEGARRSVGSCSGSPGSTVAPTRIAASIRPASPPSEALTALNVGEAA